MALGANYVTHKGLPATLCLHLWEVSRSIARATEPHYYYKTVKFCFSASFSFGREFLLEMFSKERSISEKDLKKVFLYLFRDKVGRILCQCFLVLESSL